MAATSISTSTSTIQKSFKYNVFLSFSGEDTRKTFIDHFYEALQGRGIYTYKDDERLEKGKIINQELLQSIEDSKSSIIVFSKKYASSCWCLNELVKIMECHKTNDHIVLPVFYDVEPSEVRNQTGEVGKAFAIHNKEEAKKWREALKEAGNLAGFVLKNMVDGHEAKFIKKIVEQISLELCSINVYVDKKVVGMEPRLNKVLSSLETSIDDTRIIGIKGIGGSGKTTLARAIFDQISAQFEGKSFVENVREVSKATLSGLQSLQKQVLSDISNEKDIIVSSVHNGKNMMKNMWGRKVLIVLDDVDDIDQLEALVGELNWFKAGSRIIITTRDEQVLRVHGVKIIQEVDPLSNKEAICLFSRYAFGSDVPIQGFEELSLKVVNYAAGLPLMIRVLGAFLCGKDELEWIDQLERLKTNPLKGTLDILELSYVGLEQDLKDIFLDVACFLKGSHKNDAIRILESCGFNPRIGLRVLELKSLITISSDQYLGMHDRIQEMGRNIVRRVYPDDPNRHSRLWILQEIEDILANDLGTEETRAIAVDDSHVQLNSEIVTKGFGNMTRLRFVRMVSDTDQDDCSPLDENTNTVSQSFPCTLRYLSWEFYPHWSLPKTFRPNNLVALEMSDCRIVQLWEGEQKKVLNKLRFLVLSHSKLRSLDLSLTPNLEKLDLEGCQDLVELRTPDGCLKRLVSLNLTGCSRISSFLFIKRLESLKFLRLTCLFLEEFPDIIASHSNNSLLELQFRHNNIEKLPSSIGYLQKLTDLDLHSCRKLRSLPQSICDLQYLRNLKLYGCSLEELPKNINHLGCLEKLNLSFALIKSLPDSICMLKNLKKLNLSFCRNLETLPRDLGQLECLQKLILSECTRIEDIPDSICMLRCLKYFSLLNCIKLEKLPEKFGFSECLEVLNLKGTRIRRLPPNILSLQGLKINEASSGSGTIKASSIRKQKY